ncbi:hypothetical protein [Cerasicoccus frondis]|uniref:hypothetical protein n=1 Tax=Cerasicoccus frondis TaxID=490090 RepID=UPI00285294B2|nr:hypothetical protein [Cerasicoccus frondis]
MKSLWRLFALATFAFAATSLSAESQSARTLPLSEIATPDAGELDEDDLTAGALLESGEISAGQAPGNYSEAYVETFLNQFVGIWNGHYEITTMRGQVLTHMDARSSYEWDLVGETRVLKNQSIYASGDIIGYSSSLTYFYFGRLVTEVEQDGVKRIFFGTVSKDGKSVSWNIANAVNTLSSSTRETFTQINGQPCIRIEGFEAVRDAMATATIAMKGELTKE